MSTASKADIERHVDKVNLALKGARIYFERTSEANAATHGSDKVLYSPIVTTLNEAEQSLKYLESLLEDLK